MLAIFIFGLYLPLDIYPIFFTHLLTRFQIYSHRHKYVQKTLSSLNFSHEVPGKNLQNLFYQSESYITSTALKFDDLSKHTSPNIPTCTYKYQHTRCTEYK